MRRHLNTLYVTTKGAWLRKDGENIVIRVDGEERGCVPIHLLGGVVCFGPVGLTPAIMGHCAGNGVCLSLLSRTGRFLARVEGPVSGNVLLRKQQYQLADIPAETDSLVSSILTGKLLNQRTVVRRALRDHASNISEADATTLQICEQRLSAAARRSNTTQTTDTLRGIEGESARTYFGVFNSLILSRDSAFSFVRRSRRPPLDPVNALLSFLYTLLVHDCRSALETVGLDPAVGFLHQERPGRPSLALDLMEELRPVLADRLALSLINRGQLKGKDFDVSVSGAVTMSDEARKTVLVAYQDRKKDVLAHPFLEDKTTVGLIPFVQANLLARRIRGDIDGYPPFLWR